MYICTCQGITEKQLQTASQGRSNVKEALQQLNIGTDCGTCLQFAIEAYLKYQHNHHSLSKKINPIKQR